MKVKYNSLAEAADAMKKYSENMAGPINEYETEVRNTIGTQDAEAWSGSAAEEALVVIDRIKQEIKDLQTLCSDFSADVSKSAGVYQEQDAAARSQVNDVTPE